MTQLPPERNDTDSATSDWHSLLAGDAAPTRRRRSGRGAVATGTGRRLRARGRPADDTSRGPRSRAAADGRDRGRATARGGDRSGAGRDRGADGGAVADHRVRPAHGTVAQRAARRDVGPARTRAASPASRGVGLPDRARRRGRARLRRLLLPAGPDHRADRPVPARRGLRGHGHRRGGVHDPRGRHRRLDRREPRHRRHRGQYRGVHRGARRRRSDADLLPGCVPAWPSR